MCESTKKKALEEIIKAFESYLYRTPKDEEILDKARRELAKLR